MTDEESHEDQSEHKDREQQERQRERTSVAPPTEAIILKSSD